MDYRSLVERLMSGKVLNSSLVALPSDRASVDELIAVQRQLGRVLQRLDGLDVTRIDAREQTIRSWSVWHTIEHVQWCGAPERDILRRRRIPVAAWRRRKPSRAERTSAASEGDADLAVARSLDENTGRP